MGEVLKLHKLVCCLLAQEDQKLVSSSAIDTALLSQDAFEEVQWRLSKLEMEIFVLADVIPGLAWLIFPVLEIHQIR